MSYIQNDMNAFIFVYAVPYIPFANGNPTGLKQLNKNFAFTTLI